MTQVSDVEDETNGMITYDRQVIKVDAARMRAIVDQLTQAFESTTREYIKKDQANGLVSFYYKESSRSKDLLLWWERVDSDHRSQ